MQVNDFKTSEHCYNYEIKAYNFKILRFQLIKKLDQNNISPLFTQKWSDHLQIITIYNTK